MPPVTLRDSVANPTEDRVNASDRTQGASTPTQPSPLQGEGFDRFDRVAKIKPGGVARARKLRAEPTHAEARLWKSLRLLPVRFRRQSPIGSHVVDFACLPAKLVIEVDGGVHQLTDVALRDLKRDDWLKSQGFRVMRIPNRRIEDDIDAVLAEIAQAVGVSLPSISARASTPSQPFPLEGKGSSEI